MTLRVLIVDDEALARDRLVLLLTAEPDLDIVGTAASGEDAVAAIHGLQPDLIFLDVQMPGLDGFGVVERVGLEAMPTVVFVTAYDEYALRAFEAHAVDYLLKPFSRVRFQQAVAQARQRVEQRRAGGLFHRIAGVLAEFSGEAESGPRVMVRTHGHVRFLSVEQIDWVEAERNYARLHVGQESYLVRDTMSGLMGRLGPERFARIHRSHIVNVSRVRELRIASGGDYAVVLADGTRLALSRAYRDTLQHRLIHGAK